jgi:hypothetical protein
VTKNRSDHQVNQQSDEISTGLKKYYGKNPELLNKKLTEIIERWGKEGLKKDVLIKLKDKIVAVFGMMS